MMWSFLDLVLARSLNIHVPKCFWLKGWILHCGQRPMLRFGLMSSRTEGSGGELSKRGSRSQSRSPAQPQLHGLQGQGTSNHLLGPSCLFKTRVSQVLQSISCHIASN